MTLHNIYIYIYLLIINAFKYLFFNISNKNIVQPVILITNYKLFISSISHGFFPSYIRNSTVTKQYNYINFNLHQHNSC